MILELIQNVAFLVALAVSLQILARRLAGRPMLYGLSTGFLFGVAGIAGMMTPMHFAPGVIYDGRSIVLSLAGLFGGPAAGLLAGAVCAVYRAHLGGPGAVAGVGTILEATALGIALYFLRRRNEAWVGAARLWGFAFLVHVIMLLLQLLIPNIGWEVLYRVGPTVLVFYPLGFLLIAQVFLDGERRRKAEEDLSASERKYRELVENANSIIIRMDSNGTILFFNEFAQRFFGYAENEIIGRNAVGTIVPESESSGRDLRALVRDITRNTDLYAINENENMRRDGERVWVAWTNREVVGANPDAPEFLCVGQDVTARKRAEMDRDKMEVQLRQAQKMEAVGQLAGGIAHDFNNLLQVILGYMDFLKVDVRGNPDQEEAVEAVAQAAERAADLTRQLLAFSRRQIIQPVNLNLNDLISGVLKIIRRVIGENIDLQYVPGERLGTVHVDKGQMEQILMNLCVNARDAMPQGGTLTIETENVFIGRAYCLEHPWATEGRYVLLSVTDTGVGMDELTRAQAFEPFFTTKGLGEGTGLGLATVYGIVKQHNGLIHVYSEPDKGTSFKVYIPIVERHAEDVGTKVETRAAGGSETILVAEDEEGVRKVVCRILESAGYAVLEAAHGEEALRLFEAHADTIDMVLLDVIMPKVGGREVMDRIQAKNPEVRFLFSSGYSENAIHTNFVAKDGLRFIMKPYSKSSLLHAVRETLDAP